MDVFTQKNVLKVLTDDEIIRIIEASYKILENTGFMVENNEILSRLNSFGGRVDKDLQRVCFDRQLIENFLQKTDHVEWKEKLWEFSAEAEIYSGWFLDPEDNRYKEWSEKDLLKYIRIAKSLPDIDGVFMLGCPVKEVSPHLQPLYEKLYCWKYGLRGGEAIWENHMCEPIIRMMEVYSRECKKEIQNLYHGTVYIISPLKLGRTEAFQVMFFHERGLSTSIKSGGGSLGASYPVTLAGALAVWLAEHIAIGIIEYVLLNKTSITLGGSISSMEMATGSFQYGRPEKCLSLLATSQIANYLKLEYKAHSGLSDSKVPGFESGVQKLMSTLISASVCGKGNFVAGLLGTDEIYSPVQMILENELVSALKYFSRGMVVDEDTLALDAIHEAGPGGSFISSEHTAINFLDSLWQTSLWSKEMFNSWKEKGMGNDIDKAEEIYMDIINNGKALETFISEETENKLLKIIDDIKDTR